MFFVDLALFAIGILTTEFILRYVFLDYDFYQHCKNLTWKQTLRYFLYEMSMLKDLYNKDREEWKEFGHVALFLPSEMLILISSMWACFVNCMAFLIVAPYMIMVYCSSYIYDNIVHLWTKLVNSFKKDNSSSMNRVHVQWTGSHKLSINKLVSFCKWFKLFTQTTNHMMMGFLYMCIGMLGGVMGFALSMIISLELSLPAYVLTSALQYNSNITFHGLLMIFFMIMPMLIGGFGNLLVPVLVGASDMMFPRLNALSLWLLMGSFVLLLLSMVVDGGVNAGWTFYVPLSMFNNSSIDLMLFSLHIAGLSSLLGSINFMVTMLKVAYFSVTYEWLNLPLFVWSMFMTSVLLIISLPVLAGCITMIMFDSHFNTASFDPLSGGNMLLFQHLFWFFGHPEVYMLILPAFGLISEILGKFSCRGVFGSDSMLFCLFLTGMIGLIVWGHHMFVVGFDIDTKNYFTTATSMMAIPTLIKLFNWMFTIYSSTPYYFMVHYYIMGFLINFTMGGLTGLVLANNSMDVMLHDTYFVVGHFHYVLSLSVVYIIIAAFYTSAVMMGWHINYTLANIQFIIFFISSHLLFMPFHALGMLGLPRRVFDYNMFFSWFQATSLFGSIGVMMAFVLFPFTFNSGNTIKKGYIHKYTEGKISSMCTSLSSLPSVEYMLKRTNNLFTVTLEKIIKNKRKLSTHPLKRM